MPLATTRPVQRVEPDPELAADLASSAATSASSAGPAHVPPPRVGRPRASRCPAWLGTVPGMRELYRRPVPYDALPRVSRRRHHRQRLGDRIPGPTERSTPRVSMHSRPTRSSSRTTRRASPDCSGTGSRPGATQPAFRRTRSSRRRPAKARELVEPLRRVDRARRTLCRPARPSSRKDHFPRRERVSQPLKRLRSWSPCSRSRSAVRPRPRARKGRPASARAASARFRNGHKLSNVRSRMVTDS